MDTNSPHESPIGAWITGAVMGVLALLALLLASRAQDGTFFLFAVLLFGFCVVMIFAMITKHTGGARH